MACELSYLLRKFYNDLAGKLDSKMAKTGTKDSWADELGYSPDAIQNWLRRNKPSRPPDTIILHLAKKWLNAGFRDHNTLTCLRKVLPAPMWAELQPLLPRDGIQERIVILNVASDQPLADFLARHLSPDFYISHSPDRFSNELPKATGAIGIHTSAAAQNELFHHWLEEIQRKSFSVAVLVHDGSIARVDPEWIEGFQTVYWPKAPDRQQQSLERLHRILRGDTVEEENIFEVEDKLGTRVEREDLGGVPIHSPFYIERISDRRALRTVDQQGGCNILIKGPRQVGKTSLLIRVAHAARQSGKRVIELNLQGLGTEMSDLDDLFYALCKAITKKLKLEDKLAAFWDANQDESPGSRCQSYLLEHVLANASPLVLALDEVDAVYDKPIQNDFFGILRSWINEGRTDTREGRLMACLELAMVTSTEPGLFIKEHQSPFNVLEPIVLHDFTLEQTSGLNQKHHDLLNSRQLEQLFALLNGHIYLTRRAMNLITLQDFTFTNLMKTANDTAAGPFSSHLETLWDRLPKQPEILKTLKQILGQGKCDDEKILHRLIGAGLVIVTGRDRKLQARCELYEIFLKERLRK